MPTLSASYGACYTYNSKLNPLDAYASRRKSSLTGPFFGLSIVLNLEQKTYLKAGITKQVSNFTCWKIWLISFHKFFFYILGRSTFSSSRKNSQTSRWWIWLRSYAKCINWGCHSRHSHRKTTISLSFVMFQELGRNKLYQLYWKRMELYITTMSKSKKIFYILICIRSIRKFREIDLHFKNQRLVVILPFWKLVDVSIQCFWTKMMKNLWKDLPAI